MTNYTDKELLMLAAKAAGINGQLVDAHSPYVTYAAGSAGSYRKVAWSPLTDDGDALRLAVKISHFILTYSDDDWERCNHDGYAATRRAIARAAAAIGEKL